MAAMAAALRFFTVFFFGAVSSAVAHMRGVPSRKRGATIAANIVPSPSPASLVQRSGGVFDSRLGGWVYNNVVVSNPAKWWLPEITIRHILDREFPIAPEDRLSPGVAMQHNYDDAGPPPRTRDGVIVYYSPWDDKPGPFPQEIAGQVPFQMQPPLLRGNRLQCSDAPQDWVDAQGGNCGVYQQREWCTSGGQEGMKWDQKWGTLADWKSKDGMTSMQACCACGGGKTEVFAGRILTPLEKRRLIAPEDKLPSKPPLEAPLDGGSRTDAAAEDTIGLGYSRYLYETELESLRKDPPGLSVRYYGAPPTDCSKSGGVLPKARVSAIDKFIKFGEGPSTPDLRAPAKHINKAGGFFWGRWSGTLQILTPGLYTFNLDVGFNSESTFKVDGQALKTPGQCRVSPDEGACKGKGCTWNADNGVCANGAAPTPAQAFMKPGGHCLEAIVMVTPDGNGLDLQYQGPDTSSTMIVIPAQVLYCDPVIPACTKPEMDACKDINAAYAANKECPEAPADAANDVPPGLAPAAAAAGPAPAAAAAPPPKRPIILTFKLQNIDWGTLQATPPVLQALGKSIRIALVSVVDNAVAMEDIDVKLAGGSVMVEATVQPPPDADNAEMMETFDQTRKLAKAVVEEVEAVPGIEEAQAGAVGVTRLEVKEGEIPTTTPAPYGPAPGPAGPGPAPAPGPAQAPVGVAMVVAVAEDEASTEADVAPDEASTEAMEDT